MADQVIVDRDGGGGAASSAIWAIALLIIVALVVGAVYYSGILTKSGAKDKINVEVSAPSAPSSR
jgi:hypothetical protein